MSALGLGVTLGVATNDCIVGVADGGAVASVCGVELAAAVGVIVAVLLGAAVALVMVLEIGLAVGMGVAATGVGALASTIPPPVNGPCERLLRIAAWLEARDLPTIRPTSFR